MARHIGSSWQSKVLNIYLRRVQKKVNNYDIKQSRDFLASADRLHKLQHEAKLQGASADGVPGEWLTMPESRETSTRGRIIIG